MPEPKRKSSAMWGSSSSNNNNINNNNKKTSRHHSRKNINLADAEKLWNEIVDEGTVASMEGISILCEKLDLDPLEDIRVLVLLWKMGATSKPAQISREEWMKGCEKLQVDTVTKFKELLPSLEVGFLDNDEFKEFYKVRRLYLFEETCLLSETLFLLLNHFTFNSFAFNSIARVLTRPSTRSW